MSRHADLVFRWQRIHIPDSSVVVHALFGFDLVLKFSLLVYQLISTSASLMYMP